MPPGERRETVTLRLAGPADEPRLRRLAHLDCQPMPRGPMLLAEVEDELRAAVTVDGTRAIADPFEHTGELLGLLHERARQLCAPYRPPRRTWLWRRRAQPA